MILKQKQEKQYGSHEPYHDNIKALPSESVSGLGHLIHNILRACNPSDKDAGSYGKDRHDHVIAEIIQDIQYLGRGSVGKRYLEVKLVISHAYDGTHHESYQGFDDGSLLS